MANDMERFEKEGGAGAPEEEGIIVKITGDLARVKILKSSSCANCTTASGCPFNSIGKKEWLVWAKNQFGAVVGDTVKVAIAPSKYLLIAAMIFILPVATLLISYMILSWIGLNEQLAVGTSVIFAFLSYILVRSYDKRSANMANYLIVQIVSKTQTK